MVEHIQVRALPCSGSSAKFIWKSTHRYQLEAFVDMVRGKQPPHWVAPENSIAQMETIDMVYDKSGLGRRRPTHEVLSSRAEAASGEGTSPSAP